MDSEDLVNLLKRLSGKEQQVLILRFGIGLPEGLTLDEIVKKYNVTRERIRQIESKALSKLRKNNHGLIESYFGKSK